MKLGLRKKYFDFFAHHDLFRFRITKLFFGFAVANNLLSRLNKYSLIPILKKYGATIGENCDIETGLTLHNCKDYSNLIIGNNCHVGKNCFFDLRNKITIGDNVVISMQCTFITHIDMSKSPLEEKYPAKSDVIYIEDNGYIGARATILKGVTIHENAFVAAGTLVTNDVDENTMVGGVPAKIVKRLN